MAAPIFLEKSPTEQNAQANLLRFLEDGSSIALRDAGIARNVRCWTQQTKATSTGHRQGTNSARTLSPPQRVVSFACLSARARGRGPLLRCEFLGASRCSQQRIKNHFSLGSAEMIAHHWPGNVRELRNVVERTLSGGLQGKSA